jgi:hypothetical protein
MIEIEKGLLATSVGGLAAGFMATTLISDPFTRTERQPEIPFIIYRIADSTYGELFGSLVRASRGVNYIATQSIVFFYSTLLSNQERLGRDFEEVLFDNLWDLYAR